MTVAADVPRNIVQHVEGELFEIRQTFGMAMTTGLRAASFFDASVRDPADKEHIISDK